MQTEKECYLTHRRDCALHKHHIFEGNGRRKLSEQYGCWVYLIPSLHNMSSAGVHANKALDLRLKQECQLVFEKTHDRTEFIRIFGRSYL